MNDTQELNTHLVGLTPLEISMYEFCSKMATEEPDKSERANYKKAAEKIAKKSN